MKIGIAGLGLMGGSIAKAYRDFSNQNNNDIKIFGFDKNIDIVNFAILEGTINGALDETSIGKCDVIFIGLYPASAVEYLENIAPLVSKSAYVIDLCGTKQAICSKGFALAEKHGFTFIGGHPMAGTQFSGYKHSKANMFKGAPMVIVPPRFDDASLLQKVRQLLTPLGFEKYSFTTAEEHDSLIAFTSQLAHVVSNAYVKSPTAKKHWGFSAGSYKDLTRVAWLNETMWTELFFENKEPLLYEIDTIISSLTQYRDALESGDQEKMHDILREGRVAKELIDG